MIRAGRIALDALAEAAAVADDPAASSHWRTQHADFAFTGDGFKGLRGFGGLAERRPHRTLGHRVFQRPFRALGAALPAFQQLDALGGAICAAQDRVYDLDVLRNVLTLAFLQRHVPERLRGAGTACVIGDGFGTMAALLLGSRAVRRVVLVNLTRTLLVDLWYLRRWLGEECFERRVILATDAADIAATLARDPDGNDNQIIAIQAAQHQLLRECPIDVAVNMVSMGEMDPPVTAAYFTDLRAAAAFRSDGLAFYCCNREEKVLPDGTITRFADYPWRPDEQIHVDELCPWHQRYYAFRPPFYRAYDGPIRHRLAMLSPDEQMTNR